MAKKLDVAEWLPLGLCVVALGIVLACGDKSPQPADARESSEPVTAAETATVTPTTDGAVVVTGAVSFERGDSAFRARRYEEAAAVFTAYVEGRPENPWGYYMLGLSAWKAGDRGRAETALRRTVELDSTHVKGRLNLSRVLLETERPAEALEQIDAALLLDEASAEGHRLLGRACDAIGAQEGAIAAYQRAIVLDSTDVWAINNLGVVLIEQERFEEALKPLARAVELAPDVPTFRNNLGMALERTGRYSAAAESYRSVLAADSGYTKATVSLERVSGLKEDPGVSPIDLTGLARAFETDVETWREAIEQGHKC